MILRGSNRLRVLLMGAATVGIFGSQHFVLGDGTVTSTTSSKKPAPSTPSPVPPAQQPALLPVPTAPVIVPVAQSQGASSGKSEVQRQLELLYEQDGREMPNEMNMEIQPVPLPGSPEAGATKGAPNAAGGNPAPGANGAPNVPSQQMPQQPQAAQPAPADASKPPVSKNPVMAFFRKLKPAAKDKPTPAPTAYRPDVAPVPPETSAASVPKRPQPRTHIDYAPAQLKTTPQPVNAPPALTNAVTPMVTPATSGTQLPPLDGEARVPIVAGSSKSPQIFDLPPSPLSTISTPPVQGTALPPLMTQSLPPQAPPAWVPTPQAAAPLVAAPQVAPAQPAAPPPALAPSAPPQPAPQAVPQPEPAALAAETPAPSDFVNPFTEMSEAEADKKLGPFTGLTLEEDSGKTGSKTKAANAPIAAKEKEPVAAKGTADQEDPFAEELRKLGIVPPGTEQNQPVAKKPVAKLSVPSSDSPSFDGIENQATRDKMKKIHERGSMKGLKGFCPVTLHDQRELVDAKPEFHSTYRGQKFHFADAEAKLRFDEDPARYAPAAYGADVVALTRDKDVVEGTLDFAAWFKGRLYLFGAQEAHDTFVANPGLYATPIGIE